MVEKEEHVKPSLSSASLRRTLASSLVLNLLVNLLLYMGHIIIARRLPRTDYAVFTVVVSFVSLMALFADLGLTLLFVRKFAAAEALAAAGKKDDRGELLGSMLLLRFGMAVIVSIVVVLITPALGYPLETRHLMMIMLVTLFISSRLLVVRSVGEAFLRGHNKYHLVALFAAVDALVFVGVLYFYSGKILDLEGAVWIYSLCHIPGFLLLFGLIYRDARSIGFRIGFRFAVIGSMIREGFPLILSTVFLTIHNSADPLLLDKLSTPFEVSAFGASIRVQSALMFLPAVFSAVLAPGVTRFITMGKIDDARELVNKGIKTLLVLSGAVAFGITALPTTTIYVLFGDNKYLDIAPLIVLLAWAFVGIAYSLFIIEIAIAEGKQWLSMIYMFISMCISVSLDFALIPSYGARGATWARFVSLTVASLAVWQLTRKITSVQQKVQNAFMLRFACCLLIGFAVHYLFQYLAFPEILDGVLTIVMYGSSAHFFGLFHVNDFSFLFPKKLRTTS